MKRATKLKLCENSIFIPHPNKHKDIQIVRYCKSNLKIISLLLVKKPKEIRRWTTEDKACITLYLRLANYKLSICTAYDLLKLRRFKNLTSGSVVIRGEGESEGLWTVKLYLYPFILEISAIFKRLRHFYLITHNRNTISHSTWPLYAVDESNGISMSPNMCI